MTSTTATATTAPESSEQPPVPSPPAPLAAGRSRRRLLVVAALVVVVLIAAVVAAVKLPRHHRSATPTTPTATGPAQQGKLLSALHAANRMTLHATYRALGDPTKLGGTLTYEVWQRPPDGREDRNGSPSERCHQDGSDIWTCSPAAGATPAAAGAAPGPLDLLAAISRVGSAAAARDAVTTSADVIGDLKVTCYQLAAPGQTYVLCTAANGVPELIANTTVRYELVTSSANVPSSALTP
jgi:hypothetical protein